MTHDLPCKRQASRSIWYWDSCREVELHFSRNSHVSEHIAIRQAPPRGWRQHAHVKQLQVLSLFRCSFVLPAPVRLCVELSANCLSCSAVHACKFCFTCRGEHTQPDCLTAQLCEDLHLSKWIKTSRCCLGAASIANRKDDAFFFMAIRTAQVDTVQQMLQSGAKVTAVVEPVS